MSELSFHIETAKLLNAYARQDTLHFHVPNGEKRDPRTAARLKQMGVRAGVADFTIIVNGGVHFLELKTSKGRLSTDQIVFSEDAERAGASFHVAHSLDDVIDTLNRIGALRVVLNRACGGRETQSS